MTNNENIDSVKSVLDDLRAALEKWIPKRKDTVSSLEELAERLKSRAETVNTVKLGVDAVGVASGILAIVNGESPAAISLVGVGCAVVSFGAGLIKSRLLSQLLIKANHKIEEEKAEYTAVESLVIKLARLYVNDPSKCQVSQKASELLRSVAEAAKHGRSLVTIATDSTANASGSVLSLVLNAGMSLLSSVVAQNSAVSVVNRHDSRSAVNRGQRSAANVETFFVSVGCICGGIFGGAGGDSDEDDCDEDYHNKGGGTRISSWSETKNMIHVSAISSATGKFRQTLRKAIPFFRFGVTIWNGFQCYKTAEEILNGTEQELALRQEISKRKEEANNIVNTIFNSFFQNPNDQLTFP